MKPARLLPLLFLPLSLSAPLPAQTAPLAVANVTAPAALKWDAETREANPKPGEDSAALNFVVTNVSEQPVLITRLRTSCGCTVAQLPSTPYKLDPGSHVSIAVTLNLRGKIGTLAKTVTVETSAGNKTLLVRANIPHAPAAALPVSTALSSARPSPKVSNDRAMNIQNALADRQAIFKGDCASCHVTPGTGKTGAELFTVSCGICHEAEHRAAMVPDLKVPRGPRDTAFWQTWITRGKPGTLMPAFAAAHGGPLTPEQIASLTAFLHERFPGTPQTVARTP